MENNNDGLKLFTNGITNVINETYSYANSYRFYGVLPAYMRTYAWRYIKPSCEWLDGFVPKLHGQNENGSVFVSTRIGNALITGLTKQVVGEKLLFHAKDANDNSSKEALAFVGQWAEKQNILKAVYGGVGFALGVGTSLIKMNKDNDGEIWWEAVRFDSCYYLSSFKNIIKEATFVIRSYDDTRANKTNQQFYLVEHRYYKIYDKAEFGLDEKKCYRCLHAKGEKVAMVEYKVLRVKGTMTSAAIGDVESKSVKWQELPLEIRSMISEEYSAYRVDEPRVLGFVDLGVQPLLNGNLDIGVPRGTNYGESLLIKVQSDLITYDIAASYKLRDMYLGKGTVYQPKSLSMSDISNDGSINANPLNGYGESKYELIKGVDPEQQKAIVQQFAIRENEWQAAMDNCVRNIAVKWGMSPKILSSYLANGVSQMTATQVDSEDDISIAFIYHTRSYFKQALNDLLESTLNYYGKPANILIDFASPSLINKDRILEREIKMLENGLTTIDDVIRTIYPDLDEETIQSKIEQAKADREKINLEQFNNFNDEGTFGADDGSNNFNVPNLDQESPDNIENNLVSKKLNGSTDTNQQQQQN